MQQKRLLRYSGTKMCLNHWTKILGYYKGQWGNITCTFSRNHTILPIPRPSALSTYVPWQTTTSTGPATLTLSPPYHKPNSTYATHDALSCSRNPNGVRPESDTAPIRQPAAAQQPVTHPSLRTGRRTSWPSRAPPRQSRPAGSRT